MWTGARDRRVMDIRGSKERRDWKEMWDEGRGCHGIFFC